MTHFPPECLVFMPMLPGYERAREVVARAIVSGAAAMRRLEAELPDSDWHRWLIEALDTATFALADLTDHNPFVTYELGLAHSRRIPTMLIIDGRNERISPTVRGSMFLPYYSDDFPSFERRLSRWIAWTVHDFSHPPANGDRSSYERALRLLEEFHGHSAARSEPVTRDEFAARLFVTQSRGAPWKGDSDEFPSTWYLLSHIIRDSDRTPTMNAIEEWARSKDSFVTP